MKIIITNSFKTKFKKIISLIDLNKLCKKIKENNLILLNQPYVKLKLFIWWIAIRWILLKTKWWNIVFLILCFKKDKNCWDNLTFETYKKEIIFMETKVLEDIEKWDFKIYE